YGRRPGVLGEALGATGTGDRDDPLVLGQQPGQGDLAGGTLLGLRQRSHPTDERLVGRTVLRGEPRDGGADVAIGKIGGRTHGPGEEALAQWAERHEPD